MPQIGQTSGKMSDRALNKTIILDTEDDIATKISIVCSHCNADLTINEIHEEPEVATVLQVGSCDFCQEAAHHQGFLSGQDIASGRGY